MPDNRPRREENIHRGEDSVPVISLDSSLVKQQGTRDQQERDEWRERIESNEDTEREQFVVQLQQMLSDSVRDYVKHVDCNDDEKAYQSYQTAVEQYHQKSFLKKLFSQNPEIVIAPAGYEIARVIELYIETMYKDSQEPIRIVYPAAGGDVAQLLGSIELVKDKNITLVFIDPGQSQSGTPESTLIPRLQTIAPHIQTENYKGTLSSYVKSTTKPIDIFLYHTPSLNRTLSIGPEIFHDVDMEQLEGLLSEHAMMLGNNEGIEHLTRPEEKDFFSRQFTSIENPRHLPVSLKRSSRAPSADAKAA